MKPDAQPEKSPEEIVILDKINAALAKLGNGGKWQKAPEFLPEYQILKGKKIIIVDDILLLLKNVLPELVVASDGNAEAIHYTNQTLEELVSELLLKQPDIILLDYNLSRELKGTAIVKELYRAGFKGKIVGISSEPQRDREFKEAGAIGNMDIDDYPLSNSIKNLASLLK